MKVKLYNFGVVTDILDCADIDEIVNPCYFDDVVQIKMCDHTSKLADSVVFVLEGEES